MRSKGQFDLASHALGSLGGVCGVQEAKMSDRLELAQFEANQGPPATSVPSVPEGAALPRPKITIHLVRDQLALI